MPSSTQAEPPHRRLGECLHPVVAGVGAAAACLAIACGLAIFARRPDEELSLLDGIAARLSRLKKAGRSKRGRGENQEEDPRRLQRAALGLAGG